MSTQWTLVAQVDDGSPAWTIERVCNLSAAEVALLDEAEGHLASLTASSPYQAAVVAHTSAIEAFENVRADTTEFVAARQDRASRALQLVMAAIATTPAESLRVASEILGADAELAGVVSAVDRIHADTAWQMLSDALVDGVPHLVWTKAVGGLEALLVARDGSYVRIEPLLAAVMQGLALIAAEVFVASAEKIQTASRVVRGLESEVLFGRATLAAFPAQGTGGQAAPMQVRELRVDLVAAAQGTLRRARTLLMVGAAQSQGAQDNVGDSVADAAASAQGSGAPAETTENRQPRPPVVIVKLRARPELPARQSIFPVWHNTWQKLSQRWKRPTARCPLLKRCSRRCGATTVPMNRCSSRSGSRRGRLKRRS